MKKYSILIISLAILSVTGCSFRNINESRSPAKKPKNIVLFIGDGMGIAHLNAGMDVVEHTFALETFPFTGFCKTFSFDNYVTDSGAGGTAIACGVKTRNGMIGMDPDTVAVPSIVELAKKNGLATGVISTSSVTHATPASFVSHNSGRGNYEEIAKDFLNNTLDLFIGGGEDHFRNRADGADLTVTLKKQGFDVVYTLDDLKESQSTKLAGLLAKEHMPYVLEGRQGMLREMTIKALETLSKNKNGFFLMIEASQIDWAAHGGDLLNIVAEVIDMDDAVGASLEFAKANGETLIVVTADHETGGLSLVGGDKQKRSINGNFISTYNHTGVMVPILSYGPGAERFTGIHDNTFFFGEFLDLLKIKK